MVTKLRLASLSTSIQFKPAQLQRAVSEKHFKNFLKRFSGTSKCLAWWLVSSMKLAHRNLMNLTLLVSGTQTNVAHSYLDNAAAHTRSQHKIQ